MTKKRLTIVITALLLLWSGLVFHVLADWTVDAYKYDVIDREEFYDRSEQPTFEDASAVRERTVVFYGEEYTGSYQNSYLDVKDGGKIDSYEFNDGVFDVLRSSGTMVYFSMASGTPKEDMTYANALSSELIRRRMEVLSRKILSEYIELSDYVFDPYDFYYANPLTAGTPFTGWYHCYYYRYIDGMKTNERVTAYFNMSGEPRGMDVRTIFTEKEFSYELDVQRFMRSAPKSYCDEIHIDRWRRKVESRGDLILHKRWDGELILLTGDIDNYLVLRNPTR